MRAWLAIPCLVLTVWLAHGNTLFNGFVYDDDRTVEGSEFIGSLGNLGGVFSQRYYEGTIESTWRPVTTITYFLDRAVLGPDAWGFHLSSVLWHMATCVALWVLLRRLVGGGIAPTLAAALFAIHPLGTEAVSGIAFREDLLATLFVVLTLSLSHRVIRGEGWISLLLPGIAVCHLLACLSKENGTVAVALVGLWWWLLPTAGCRLSRGRAFALAAVLIGVSLLWAVLHFGLMTRSGGMPAPSHWGGSRAAALWNFPRIFFHGLRLFAWPSGLSADYEWTAAPLGTPRLMWLGWLGVIAWAVAIPACRGRAPALGLGLGWWLIGLLPVSHIMPLFNPVADRYYHLPMAGLCIAVGWGIDALGRREVVWPVWSRRLALAGALVVGALLLRATVARNLVWGDAELLWAATLAVEPRSTVALNNLAVLSLQRGEPEAAIALLERAMAIDPTDGDALYTRGAALAMCGRWAEAQRDFQRLAREAPGDGRAHWGLAQCLMARPEPDPAAAREHLRRAESLGFEFPEALAAQATSSVPKGRQP